MTRVRRPALGGTRRSYRPARGEQSHRAARRWAGPMVAAFAVRTSRAYPANVEPAAHNGLVGGSSPPGPATQSDPNRRFPVSDKEPAIGGPFCGLKAGRAVSAGCRGRAEGDFAARSLGSENPFLAPSDRLSYRRSPGAEPKGA